MRIIEEKIKALILQCSMKIANYKSNKEKSENKSYYDKLIEENEIIIRGLRLLLKEFEREKNYEKE